jgi:branched-chain amino acid aminotransferase
MAPPAPLSSISWSTLGLTVTDLVNGHVECTYSLATSTWSSPRFVTDPYLRIHGLSPALNYGQQCYEGLKALRSPSPTNAITIFRPRFHAARMAHSAAAVSLPPVPEDLFLAAISLAVQRNAEFVGPADSSAVLYIRPLLFGSGPQLALEPPAEFTFAVYVQPATTYHGTTPLPCLIMEGFDRAATRGVGNAKVGGNYAPVMRHSREAKAKGFYVTLHLDSATMAEVEEFSTSGFVGVRKPREGVEGEGKGTLVVPDSKQVIDSVTSDSLQEVARGLGYTVEKRKVPYEELREFSEVLAVGTAGQFLRTPFSERRERLLTFTLQRACSPLQQSYERARAISSCTVLRESPVRLLWSWVLRSRLPSEERWRIRGGGCTRCRSQRRRLRH